MTAQVHEKLIYEGEEISMACEPDIPFGATDSNTFTWAASPSTKKICSSRS